MMVVIYAVSVRTKPQDSTDVMIGMCICCSRSIFRCSGTVGRYADNHAIFLFLFSVHQENKSVQYIPP